MTVKELIEKLDKIKDKNKRVYIGVDKEVTNEFEVIEMNDSVNLFD